MGDAVNGDFLLFHNLQKRGLRLRRCTVDLIGQHDGGENRAFAELEFSALLIVESHTHHIRRQQIGRELNTLETGGNGIGQASGQLGLTGAGVVFKQNMATDHQCGDALLDRDGLADNHLGDILDQRIEGLLEIPDLSRGLGQ